MIALQFATTAEISFPLVGIVIFGDRASRNSTVPSKRPVSRAKHCNIKRCRTAKV